MDLRLLFLLLVIVLFLIFTSAGRQALVALTGSTAQGVFAYLVLLFKHIIKAHIVVLKNLLLPRNIIFPTLENGENTGKKGL